MLTEEQVEKKIEETRRICSPKSSRLLCCQHKALRNIADIIRRTTRKQLLAYQPNHIIVCTLRVVLYFDGKGSQLGNMCDWKRRRRLRAAKECYYNLLKTYIPERSVEVVNAVVNAICQEKYWEFETFCLEIILNLLEYGASGVTLVHAIWDKVESLRVNVQDRRGIVKILYETLDGYTWPESHETVEVIERILHYFYASITKRKSSEECPHDTMLKRGLEICLRNVVKNLSNDHLLIVVQHMCSWVVEDRVSDDIVLEFGSTLEYAAYMHKVSLYEKTLTPRIFPMLLDMIGSQSKLISLLGNRVFQYFLERKENRIFFDTPRIFFEDTEIDLKIGRCYKEDKLFCKLHREILHDGLLKSMLNHSDARMNLETTYCTICLLAVEVPCGFTAAALVCLAMNIQDLTLKRIREHSKAACHMHAAVISIMSLICWIHKAKVFYQYVNKIITERAQSAPHLNPPIRSVYSFALHHVFWEKSELFFVDWEARYGLWKCFRLRDGAGHTMVDENLYDRV